MSMKNRHPILVLLILLAVLAAAATMAASAAALPTFTNAVGGIGPCNSCHTQAGTHTAAAHASVYPTCSNCHVNGDTAVPPTPTKCAVCHGGTGTILSAHPAKGCSTTPGCHGVVVTTPVVTSFAPASGAVGTEVTVTGTGFPGATAVTFNGVATATFSILDPSTIKVTVPAGATSGPIAVTTSSGTGTSAMSFTVPAPAKPKIAKLSPKAGKRGSTVTITGTAFGAKRLKSVVKFGSVKVSKYVSWGKGKIKVKVPKAKFGTVKVSVKTSAGKSNTKSFKVKR